MLKPRFVIEAISGILLLVPARKSVLNPKSVTLDSIGTIGAVNVFLITNNSLL